ADHVGCRSLSRAAAPATPGDDMLVPSSVPNLFPGDRDERTPTPGAETSGLNWRETGVGPAEEKYAILFALSTAATAIAPRAFAGEPTDRKPFTSKSFPAEATTTTPAAAAPSIAVSTRSRLGSTSGSPTDRLTTSIPSATAASSAAAISALLPSSPNVGVG